MSASSIPSALTDSPLLADYELPPFGLIQPAQIEPAIQALLADNRRRLDQMLQQGDQPSWESLVEPLIDLEERLEHAWSPVSHLNSVANNEALRQAYNACLPLLSDYTSELGQSEPLYRAYEALAQSQCFTALAPAQQQAIRNALRDFRLAGVSLTGEDKQKYREIKKRLAELASKFSENVLDATQAWSCLIGDPAELAGVPDSVLAALRQAAQQKGKAQAGEAIYLVTLDYPSYFPLMTYCANRALRKQVYDAYITRASDKGPHARQWDNSALMDEILSLRASQAALLGFANYAEYSLATKMAGSTREVTAFLRRLAEHALPFAQREYAELADFAAQSDGFSELRPWDLAYYSEKLRQQRYAISQEELRPYFPLEAVLDGLFEIVSRLYGIEVRPSSAAVERWHTDVRFYDIRRGSELIGQFYLDPFARDKKRGGAWMDECKIRRRKPDGSLQLPVAYLVCNFSGPVENDPALLTHNEVTTLFHEFGHGLHHLLTEVDYPPVAGIRGVAWDAVELPSQFMENWCWEREGIALISRHYQTGATLPDALLQKMLAAKNFQAGMQTVRQLEFALFDFLIHLQARADAPVAVQEVLDEVRRQLSVVPVVDYNRFQHGFSHIFAGGYAAGYYSYKWAEVLSADAFSRFEEEGIFNATTGASFLQNILRQGGACEANKLFEAFRGRPPSIEALLRQAGLSRPEAGPVKTGP